METQIADQEGQKQKSNAHVIEEKGRNWVAYEFFEILGNIFMD